MGLNALLMCSDQGLLRLLAAALDELGIDREACSSAREAMEHLVRNYCSAMILDFDLPGGDQVARLARMAPPQRRPVVFAMIGAQTAIAAAFQAGANFVLYKPLVLDQVMRSLRAGRGFMKPDRRRSPRQPLSTIVYLAFENGTLPAMMLNLNADGLSLQAPEPIPALPEIPLRFLLPGSAQLVEGTGEVLWADDSGRAGMFFARLSPSSRRHLTSWLTQRQQKKRAAQSLGDRPRPGAPATQQ